MNLILAIAGIAIVLVCCFVVVAVFHGHPKVNKRDFARDHALGDGVEHMSFSKRSSSARVRPIAGSSRTVQLPPLHLRRRI